MQKAIVKMFTAVIGPLLNLFKSEKDRPNNHVQLARGNGGEHEQINKRDTAQLMQMEAKFCIFAA